MRTEIATLGEFGLIDRLTEGIKPENESTKYGVGDDAAVLSYPSEKQLLVTTDLLMEGVHFDLTYVPLKHLGYKSAVVNSIRRRRLCDECGKRFTTYEKVETIPLIVIKKDNNREQYDRSKIEAGVLRACHKRPISVNQINQLVDEVETEIFNREEKEIPSSLIGELVMDKLKDLEAVAYVRFASVYREFKDVNTFMSELKKMLDK